MIPIELHSLYPPESWTRLIAASGVKNYDVSLDKQTAHIITEPSLDYSTVLEKIKKTGKKVNSGSADGVAQAV